MEIFLFNHIIIVNKICDKRKMTILIRNLFKNQYRSFIISTRLLSNNYHERIQGIHDNFSEYEARLYFDQWLKSLWLV